MFGRIISFKIIIFGLAFNALAESNVDDFIFKPLSETEVIENIKNKIKPVHIEEEDISIQHEIPRKQIPLSVKAIPNPSVNASITEDEYENVDVLINRAFDASQAGQYEASILLYKKVIEMEPDNTNALFAIGALYQRLGQIDDAKREYGKLLSIEPSHERAINNYIALIAEESPSKALSQLKEMERINPEFSPVKAQMGMIYAKAGEFEIAEIYLRKAVMLAPEVINYRYNLAVVMDRAGRSQEALQLYRQILDFAGDDLSQSASTRVKDRIRKLQNEVNQ